MGERKPIGTKTRFEVFKRDSFQCQYCGKSAPEVILHVDHIKPVFTGGENDIMNLITSCAECNLGKGKRELSDNTIIEKQRKQLTELNEKREQLEMMLLWRQELRDQDDQQLFFLLQIARDDAGIDFDGEGQRQVKNLIKQFGFNEVLYSFEKTSGRNNIPKNQFIRYVAGICWKRLKGEEHAPHSKRKA